MLERFIRKVYDGIGIGGFEPAMWREVLRIVNEATVEGLANAQEPPTHEEDFYRALRHSNEVFAAFKVHSLGQGMAELLLDAEGKLKPFRQWRDEIRPLASHHVGAWLRTEYDTAVIRAHNAADWRRFVRDRDVMPNLRWMPTTSPAPEDSHREFWTRRLTLPVDDPFWLSHHPGDRWNCKCSLEQTDEPATPELKEKLGGLRPQRGLENNPGVDGHVFSDTHPYFPKSCARCAFYRPSLKDRLAALFRNRRKDCYDCPFIDGCIDRAKELETIRSAVNEERKRMMGADDMPTQRELETLGNLDTGKVLRSKKALGRLLYLCRSLDELDAARYVWNNVKDLSFVRRSPMGEGKDTSDERAKKNLQRKRERDIVAYNIYRIKYDGRTWIVKLELHGNGFEMPYFLRADK